MKEAACVPLHERQIIFRFFANSLTRYRKKSFFVLDLNDVRNAVGALQDNIADGMYV